MPRASDYHVLVIDSPRKLREQADRWDDLWRRSAAASPLARAEPVAQWIEQFAPRGATTALALCRGDAMQAALPLISSRLGGVLPEAALTGNEWSPCGELLVDAEAGDDVYDALIAACGRLPAAWLWCGAVGVDQPQWRGWAEACRRAGAEPVVQTRYEVGRTPIGDDFEAFLHSLSRSHRQAMTKALRRLREKGELVFRRETSPPVDAVEPLLFAGFEVEDRSWKGRSGTSVLRTPGMYGYFVRQAEELALRRCLDLSFVELDGRPIAFLYGYRGKGVLFAHKIGYDPQYAQFSPGQVLFYLLFEQLHGSRRGRADRAAAAGASSAATADTSKAAATGASSEASAGISAGASAGAARTAASHAATGGAPRDAADEEVRVLDFSGPMTEATARWRPEVYPLGKIVVAPRRLMGKAALYAYRRWWPRLSALRRRLLPRG